MPLRNHRLLPSNAARMQIVAWQQQDTGELVGVVHNDYLDRTTPFDSAMRLVGVMEDLMDEMDYPQAFETLRSFDPRKKPQYRPVEADAANAQELNDLLEKAPESRQAFDVQVQFRQNATWQGVVTWPQREVAQRFRSALELIKLIDEALLNSGEVGYAGWEED